jgi:hypothetical protein
MFLSIPIFLEVESILKVWLGQVPAHTVLFTRLVLILTLAEIISQTLITAQSATGKIRNYQLVVGGLQMMNLPLSYIFIRLGYPPESIFVVAIFISVCCEMARLYMLRSMINLSVSSFLKKVYFNVIFVTVIASIIPIVLSTLLPDNFIGFIFSCICCCISAGVSILFIGLTKPELKTITSKSILLFKKLLKK